MAGVAAGGQSADPQLQLVPVWPDKADGPVQLGPAPQRQRLTQRPGQLLDVRLWLRRHLGVPPAVGRHSVAEFGVALGARDRAVAARDQVSELTYQPQAASRQLCPGRYQVIV